ncbi:HMA2 domain-containing protein [Alkaliphilus serpentinus]|uniref:Uncharacterized protein n=1 Tax=Alkaliphilus serpentinus TaxID=1482731 RepID=A0A833HL98_9FIRM|nr:hypothetical protein [Alkaliphilus serpentinus]KAB3525505.1 hypothetical protein F8153_15135 [Alkaliphilus serpentinus]
MITKVLSQIPGRMRINVKNLYKNNYLLEGLITQLDTKYVYAVKANIYTSNVLIIYDSNFLKPIDILSSIHRLEKDLTSTKNSTSLNHATNSANSVSKNIFTKTLKPLLLGGIAAGLWQDLIKAPALFTADSLTNNLLILILGYPLINKYVESINNCNNIKRGLLGLGVIALPLLMGQSSTALLILTILYLHELIDLLLSNYFDKKLQMSTGVSDDLKGREFNYTLKEMKAKKNTPIVTLLGKLESFSLLLGLILLAFTRNPIGLLSAMLLTILNPIELASNLSYTVAYYNRLKHNIYLNNIDNLQNLIIIDTAIFVINHSQYINSTIIENLRERGILDIRVITNNNNNVKLKKLASDLGIVIKYYNPIVENLLKEVELIKNDNKNIVLIGNDEKLIESILEKTNKLDLSIVIKEDFNKELNCFDIMILGNNIYMLGDSLDFIKYTNEKILQNQLVSFWTYIYCIIFSFSGVIPLYTWLLSIFNKVFLYFNSLTQLEYKYSIS